MRPGAGGCLTAIPAPRRGAGTALSGPPPPSGQSAQGAAGGGMLGLRSTTTAVPPRGRPGGSGAGLHVAGDALRGGPGAPASPAATATLGLRAGGRDPSPYPSYDLDGIDAGLPHRGDLGPGAAVAAMWWLWEGVPAAHWRHANPICLALSWKNNMGDLGLLSSHVDPSRW